MTNEEKDEKIKSLLTIDFLDTLLEVGKLYGWQGDYFEIGEFIAELHRIAGINTVDTEPYD